MKYLNNRKYLISEKNTILKRSCQNSNNTKLNHRLFPLQLRSKSDSHLPKKLFFICFNESPLKLIKNAYIMLKALFFLEIFKFLSWLFG